MTTCHNCGKPHRIMKTHSPGETAAVLYCDACLRAAEPKRDNAPRYDLYSAYALENHPRSASSTTLVQELNAAISASPVAEVLVVPHGQTVTDSVELSHDECAFLTEVLISVLFTIEHAVITEGDPQPDVDFARRLLRKVSGVPFISEE